MRATRFALDADVSAPDLTGYPPMAVLPAAEANYLFRRIDRLGAAADLNAFRNLSVALPNQRVPVGQEAPAATQGEHTTLLRLADGAGAADLLDLTTGTALDFSNDPGFEPFGYGNVSSWDGVMAFAREDEENSEPATRVFVSSDMGFNWSSGIPVEGASGTDLAAAMILTPWAGREVVLVNQVQGDVQISTAPLTNLSHSATVEASYGATLSGTPVIARNATTVCMLLEGTGLGYFLISGGDGAWMQEFVSPSGGWPLFGLAATESDVFAAFTNGELWHRSPSGWVLYDDGLDFTPGPEYAGAELTGWGDWLAWVSTDVNDVATLYLYHIHLKESHAMVLTDAAFPRAYLQDGRLFVTYSSSGVGISYSERARL